MTPPLPRSLAGLVVAAALLPAVQAPAMQVQFSEVAVASGIDFTFTPGPNLAAGLALLVGGGTVGDFNGDGWDNLFVLGGGGVPDALYINDGDGTFTESATAWGVDALHMGVGASVGDIDGDGDQDLYVTTFGDAAGTITNGEHKLYRNNGDGTFTDVAVAAGVATSDSVPNGFGSTFGDYDLDGDLDLYVTGWFTSGDYGNRLFRNEGDGTFTDQTIAAGLYEIDVHGFSPRFADMNGDRYPELLVAADFVSSRYYVNDGDGTFTDATAISGTGLDCNGMGSTIADFDNNGYFDWYVTNIYNYTVPELQCGNMLYANVGSHSFYEVAEAAGVNDGYWGWGTAAGDIDLDGYEDLVEVNGYQDAFPSTLYANKPALVWLNQGNGMFQEIADSCNFDHTGQGRGLVHSDFDHDGDLDFVVFSTAAGGETTMPLKLYRNDTTTPFHWLEVDLDTSSNSSLAPRGRGSAITIVVGPRTYRRFVDGGNTYLGQCGLTAHFGVASAHSIDLVRVEWPNGEATVLTDVLSDQRIVVSPPPVIGDLNGDGSVGFADLNLMLNAWGPCPVPPATCPADLDESGEVGFADLNTLLTQWD